MRLRQWIGTASLAAGFLLAACSTPSATPPLSAQVESPRGSVIIEQLSGRGTSATWGGNTRSFQATHPVDLNPQLIATILDGVRLQPARSQTGKQALPDPSATPVFTGEDQAFLAPAIAKALTNMDPDQRVVFRVLRHTATESEITTGSLFVNRPTIQITLRRFRVKSSYGPETGLVGRQVTYSQPEAIVDNAPPQSWVLVEPRESTAAINYETVARLAKTEVTAPPKQAEPDPTPAVAPVGLSKPAGPTPAEPDRTAVTTAPTARPSTSDDLQGMKDVLSKQERELEALREELKSMRQQLTEKDTPTLKPKSGKKPATRQPDSTP